MALAFGTFSFFCLSNMIILTTRSY
jgi:hypothetical protein